MRSRLSAKLTPICWARDAICTTKSRVGRPSGRVGNSETEDHTAHPDTIHVGR